VAPTVTRWRRAIGIRSGEGRTIAIVALLFACLEAGRGFGEIGVDTLVVSRFGAGSLPYLFVGLGALGLTASLAYGAALGRVERIRLLAGLLGGSTVILLVERALISTGVEAAVLLTWLTVYAVGAIAVTIAWTMAGSVFDARQARRLFPLCTGAAIAGSFVGTLSSGLVAHAFGTETLVVLEALMFAIVGLLIVAVGRITTVRVPPRRRDRSIALDLRLGFDTVLRSPLMRLVALAYVLLSILLFSVTYPFLLAASETFRTEADLATALGLLSAAVTGTSFVVSIVLANRVYTRFGVAGAALLLPIVYLGGFGLWLVAFSFSTAALFRFTQQVTQRGLSNAAWSAFYNVVPRERRAQVLAFNDGVPGQVGTMLSGLLLLTAGSLLARDQVFWLGAITALVCTAVVVGVRRRYRAAVLDSLRTGLAEQVLEGGPGIDALARDPTVSDSLVRALSAPEPAVRRMAASLLAHAPIDRAGPVLIRVVDDDTDPSVRVAALEALAALGRWPPAAAAAEGCLLDADARVRATAVRTLGASAVDVVATIGAIPVLEEFADDPSPNVRGALACLYASAGRDPRSDAIILRLLAGPGDPAKIAGLDAARRLGDPLPIGPVRALVADPSPFVRESAVAALAAWHDSDGATADLVAALDDDADAVRAAAAGALAEQERTPPELLDVLTTGSPRAAEAALTALRGHGPAVRPEVIAWTLGRLDRATDLRRARMALSPAVAADTPRDPALDPALDFLLAVLWRRERRTVRLALDALVVLGVPEAGGVIRRCLDSDDVEVRAQAIEALDSIGDRQLPGALVRLLEAEPVDTQDRDATLAQLADDDDGWINRLARAVRAREEAMPNTTRTLGDLDTMLFLRRVPLFNGLDPEDLQRFAMTSVEHIYPAGEVMVREGDIGDELIVIVEGSVRVVHRDPDGTERLIRRFEAGDHIGELAVLREAPRAATVIAEGDGVRGLVIGGAALKAILRERPDAAMAMLATLAERITRQ
jgi:HEAT repeat protein/ATP/ADP translocase